MFKVSYVVFRFGHPHHIPLPVQGSNGMPYGYALWDARYQAHIFRFTEDQWNKCYQVILKRSNRAASVWYVKAEVEVDADSAVGKMAQDLDAARAELEDLRQRLEATEAERQTLLVTLPTGSSYDPDAEPEPTDAPATVQFPKREPSVSTASRLIDERDAPLPLADRLEALKFNELQDECSLQNAQGAQIPIETLRTKKSLREALVAWYGSGHPDLVDSVM